MPPTILRMRSHPTTSMVEAPMATVVEAQTTSSGILTLMSGAMAMKSCRTPGRNSLGCALLRALPMPIKMKRSYEYISHLGAADD